jgi:hypothetical protein
MKKKKPKHKLTDPTKMGRNLTRLCIEKGVGVHPNTRTELPTIFSIANLSGVPETTLRDIYMGENYPGMETLHKLGSFLGMKVGDLLVELTK